MNGKVPAITKCLEDKVSRLKHEGTKCHNVSDLRYIQGSPLYPYYLWLTMTLILEIRCVSLQTGDV